MGTAGEISLWRPMDVYQISFFSKEREDYGNGRDKSPDAGVWFLWMEVLVLFMEK
jgi:hypothetical protein